MNIALIVLVLVCGYNFGVHLIKIQLISKWGFCELEKNYEVYGWL